MVDFNQVLDAGDVDGGMINVVVEIPTGSNHKIEWNRKLACFELDRVEPIAFAKPCNYGFIPQTLDEDGDELDALILTEQPLTTGIFLQAKVIGVMKFVDDGEVDDKIIVVPADDRNNGNAYNSLEDLPKQLIKQLEFHFNHYKDLKKAGTAIIGLTIGVVGLKIKMGMGINQANHSHQPSPSLVNPPNALPTKPCTKLCLVCRLTVATAITIAPVITTVIATVGTDRIG